MLSNFLVQSSLVTNIVLLKVTISHMDKILNFRILDHLQTNLILYSIPIMDFENEPLIACLFTEWSKVLPGQRVTQKY